MKSINWIGNPWKARRWSLAIVTLGCLAVGLWLVAQPVAQTSPAAQPHDGESGRYIYADLAAKVIPSVVTVYVKRNLKTEFTPEQLKNYEQFRHYFDNPQLRQFFQQWEIPGPNQPMRPEQQQPDEENDPWIAKGSGSGVIISSDGYILTNWHVVGEKKDHAEIRVVLSDNTELSGKDVKLVASSFLIDLAVLKINKTGLKPIAWGDSDALRIGERVCAVGSPLDLRLTVTQGIICAKHRALGNGLGDMLQTDAVINPGSSGGALVNLDGQLIGINRLITTPRGSERWEGYGFAIPSKDAKSFADQIITKGKVAFGYIGIQMKPSSEISGKLRQALGLNKEIRGVLIDEVRPNTPAAAAGLEEDDLIISADNIKIEETNDLLGYVARRPIGSTIKLVVLRGNNKNEAREVTVKIEIAERPADLEAQLRGERISPEEPSPSDQENSGNLGLSVEPYGKHGVEGLRVTGVQPDSPAAKAGVLEGDVLLKLDREPLKAPKDLAKAIKAWPKGRPHLLHLRREGRNLLTPIDQK